MLNTSLVVFLQLGAIAALALYVAANLGANDVANSMGTSVGSKALTLRQAIIVAGILEFAGAVLFGQGVSETLATGVVNAEVFAHKPQVFLIGMVSVLAACGLWLQIATSRGLPVSSSHAVVGAIAGFSWVAAGIHAVDWPIIGRISLTWVATPFASGALAALFYSAVKYWILDRPDPLFQLREWIPWLSAALLSVFGIIVLPSVVDVAFVQTGAIDFARDRFGWNLPIHDIVIAIGSIGAIGLSLNSWKKLEKEGTSASFVTDVTDVKDRNKNKSRVNISPSPKLSHSRIEQQMARFQVLSACFVAFAHGSNDVGNAVAPLAAIAYIQRTGSLPLEDFSVPLWILVLGGTGIVIGLAIWGKNVIATVGENIIQLQPSGGFCAELATATTVLLASRLGLPVSTSHALVGAVVGVGLIKGWKSVRWQTLQSIASAWVVTIPIAAGLGASIFSIAQWILDLRL
ncbi:MAG: inorganic phosphate transporter [Microcoleus sp. PH2017_10_PVI_O_A]|uniref:inorganic phosphate transporter n=1 Tax=unclassified Microcoleus TaxID=2642155 RepID=UPI001D67F251|nr:MULTISPECIES: inorganic phosphate transporter [unclassified Microcoleus]TAE78556.1 MAG: anion permease [Oscillatoriales cyanobacterium]MCC3408349.1 inorganic phosphate transporter [Microcoleus sp. PH2017_10_PVI_O_A]MCC3462408.1 inorganic phosphate transporter [Microcoleus sp. PH2017_11_PCY_U_A]MCC3480898.1 inorganic phosphate transporter [Microcoleus sp. PH2017_12_PCY_D_A]MCC3527693.1 inorganic phosphate transporter [Microcoleus sp. PH2017_21_RUC_O_A]